MADFTTVSGKLTLRMDSGEVRDGRTIYRNAYVGNMAASPDADDVAAVCDGIGSLLQYPVDRVTLTRVDVLGA